MYAGGQPYNLSPWKWNTDTRLLIGYTYDIHSGYAARKQACHSEGNMRWNSHGSGHVYSADEIFGCQ